MKSVSATTLALAFALVGTTSMASAEVTKYSVKDNYAIASWYTSDDCSSESTFVSANESVTHERGSRPVTGSLISVSYSNYNWCTGEYQSIYGSGEGEVDAGPNSVTVTGTFTGSEYPSGESSTIDVDLSFVANGEYSSRGHSNYTFTSGGVRSRYRSVGMSESADVSGTVMIDGMNVATGSYWAEIGRSRHGSIIIEKPNN